MVPTSDPEMEIEEIEKQKLTGQAMEDDFFRDLNISEVLKSVTDEIEYHLWAAEHVATVGKMVPIGLEVLGMFMFAQEDREFKDVGNTLVPLCHEFHIREGKEYSIMMCMSDDRESVKYMPLMETGLLESCGW